MYAFDYQRPDSIAEVERLLLSDADAKLIEQQLEEIVKGGGAPGR